MISESIKFTYNKADDQNILNHLKNVENLFTPRLSSYVDLISYSNKLFNKAQRIELWDKDCLIGLVAFYINVDAIFISNVSLDKNYQKYGYGKSMMNELFSFSKSNNIYRIELEVKESNKVALNFYTNLGFIFKKRVDDQMQLLLIL